MRLGTLVSTMLAACVWLSSAAAVAADLRTNLAACRSGWPACDRSLLTASEREEVAIATEARNVRECRNGLAGRDRSLLSADERASLAVDERERNLGACRDELVGCDPLAPDGRGGPRGRRGATGSCGRVRRAAELCAAAFTGDRSDRSPDAGGGLHGPAAVVRPGPAHAARDTAGRRGRA